MTSSPARIGAWWRLSGEDSAIARALSDLSHKLLHSAAVGVASMTHEKAHLPR